jgi:hypothetical protein
LPDCFTRADLISEERMSKHKKRHRPPQSANAASASSAPQLKIPRADDEDHVQSFLSGNLLTWLIGIAALSLLAIGFIVWYPAMRAGQTAARAALATKVASTAAPTTSIQQSQATSTSTSSTNFSVMEVAQALMVTVELDFGTPVPTIADALKQIERRYEPADGTGRTFAILDAYGEPTSDSKLHMSMHVSTEKPGKAALIFKRTGQVLWQSKIVPATKPSSFSGKDLLILVDNGEGKLWTINGSNNPATVLDANVKEAGIPLRHLWFDQTEHEVTFMYSACGCPVKVKTRRDGERTVRTKDQPVIFPDDPAVVSIIQKVMAW